MTCSSGGRGKGLIVASVVACLLLACGGEEEDNRTTQAECDKLSNDIREAAESRGLLPVGVCSNADPQVQETFRRMCDALTECNNRCCR